MKRLALFLAVSLLLCACAQGGGEDRTAAIAERYVNLTGTETDAAVLLARDGEELAYTFHVTWADDGITVTVREPEVLADLSAVLVGDQLTLRCAGGVLDDLSVAGGVSAVKCVPLLIRAVTEGFAASAGDETLDGTPVLRVDYETDCDGAPLRCTLWFDGEDKPLSGEIEQDGKIIVTAEFTNFKFGDILS